MWFLPRHVDRVNNQTNKFRVNSAGGSISEGLQKEATQTVTSSLQVWSGLWEGSVQVSCFITDWCCQCVHVNCFSWIHFHQYDLSHLFSSSRRQNWIFCAQSIFFVKINFRKCDFLPLHLCPNVCGQSLHEWQLHEHYVSLKLVGIICTFCSLRVCAFMLLYIILF